MKMGTWARLLLLAAPFVAGCGDFWQAPSSTSTTGFTLSNGGNISVAPGAITGNTSVITVTPGSSFSGTVTLSCSITSGPTNAISPATCGLSSTSLTFTTTSPQTSTLTATTESGTTLGNYDITITGASGSVASSTVVCADVSSSSGTCSSAATTSGNFYILNSDSVAGYSIKTSKLTAISGTSNTVTGATAIAMAPNGNFLYVASTSGGITLYTIGSTGALTQVGSIYGDTQAEALQVVQVDSSHAWLLDASDSGLLIAIPITSTGIRDTNRLVQSNMTLAGPAVQPGQLAVSPNGAYVAVALESTGTQVFPFTSASASPIGTAYTTISPDNNSAGAAISVAMDPKNGLMYVGETAVFTAPATDSGALRVFTIGSGAPAEFTYTTPYASGGIAPNSILPNAAGTFVYVADGEGRSAGNITGFAVTTTALTLDSTVATGVQPASLAEDSTGSFVFEISDSGSPYFDAFTFDSSSSSQLNSQVTSTTAATSIAVVAAP